MKWLGAAALIAGIATGTANSQDLLGLEKQILPMTEANWVAFRNYDGRQWIYFTHLMVYRCGLETVRYSINSEALDQIFALPPCDKQNPPAIDPVAHPPYLRLPLGSADTIAVQVVYADGEASGTVRLATCQNAGETSCAVLME